MDVIIPSAIVENDFYCGHYARVASPTEEDLSRAYDASFNLALHDQRMARSTPALLLDAGAPTSLITYFESHLWGAHVTGEYVECLIRKMREERHQHMNAPPVDPSASNLAPLEETLNGATLVS
jgi:hypothetical protein